MSGWVKWGGGGFLGGDGMSGGRGWAWGEFWVGDWMSGILCIAQPARPGLIPLPAPGGGVGRRGGIRWHGVERGIHDLLIA